MDDGEVDRFAIERYLPTSRTELIMVQEWNSGPLWRLFVWHSSFWEHWFLRKFPIASVLFMASIAMSHQKLHLELVINGRRVLANTQWRERVFGFVTRSFQCVYAVGKVIPTLGLRSLWMQQKRSVKNQMRRRAFNLIMSLVPRILGSVGALDVTSGRSLFPCRKWFSHVVWSLNGWLLRIMCFDPVAGAQDSERRFAMRSTLEPMTSTMNASIPSWSMEGVSRNKNPLTQAVSLLLMSWPRSINPGFCRKRCKRISKISGGERFSGSTKGNRSLISIHEREAE